MHPNNFLCLVCIFALFLTCGCTSVNFHQPIPQGMETPADGIVEGPVEIYYERIWDAAREVLAAYGTIHELNPVTGRIEAEVGESHVSLQVIQVHQDQGNVRIQAYQRATRLPDMPLARQIYYAVSDQAL